MSGKFTNILWLGNCFCLFNIVKLNPTAWPKMNYLECLNNIKLQGKLWQNEGLEGTEQECLALSREIFILLPVTRRKQRMCIFCSHQASVKGEV